MKRVLVLVGLAVAVAFAASGAGAGAASGACPTSNPPNELVLAGGSGQTAQLGRQFPQNLQGQLANTNGCPVTGNLAGINVGFDAPSNGPSGVFAGSGSREAVVGTDAQGVAIAPPFTANDTAGSYAVDAHSDPGSVEFSLSNTATGVAAAITASGTTSEEASVNSEYPQPLQARVTDANGSPVQGATVNFSVVPGPTGAGASSLGGGPATVTTNSNGLATSPPLLANGTPGRFIATASTDGVSTVATYTLDNHAAATTIALIGGDSQEATINSRYPQPLRARVTDTNGSPVEGAIVSFSVVAGATGAGASFLGGGPATATTDSEGVATSPPLVANGTPGRFSATASTDGGAAVATYSLDNHAAANKLGAVGSTTQSATVDSRYPLPLTARLLDSDGQPIDAASITFTLGAAAANGGGAGAGGAAAGASFLGGASQATVLTDVNGLATTPPILANATPGAFTATATVIGSTTTLTYKLHNLAAKLVAGDPARSATVEHHYSRPLHVRVRGADDKPPDGATVTFTIGKANNNASASFADGTSQATVTTNSAGIATAPTMTANSIAGSFKATATLAGSKPITFTLRNRAGQPDTIATGAADGISTTIGSRLPIRLAVTVTDKNGNPVSGSLVRFIAPSNGPAGRFTIRTRRGKHSVRTVRVRTNDKGIAIAPSFTANHSAGGYTVGVRVGSRQAAFALVNRP